MQLAGALTVTPCRASKQFHQQEQRSCKVAAAACKKKCQLQHASLFPKLPSASWEARNMQWQLHSQAAELKTSEWSSTVAQDDIPFVWAKHWWPLAPIEDLDPSRPKATTVLGKQLVVWRDGQGQWRCFKDACPHRLAPLSEGRVESDGTLLCAYHAWRFNGEGKCTTIPQSTSPEAEATAKASKRSCAFAFPTQEKIGLLWAWLDESDMRWLDAAAVPVLVPRLLEEEFAEHGSLQWFMRDLPYSYEVLVENVIDPAHVPASHHKLISTYNRYKLLPMDMDPEDEPCSGLLTTPFKPTVSLRHSSIANRAVKNISLMFTAPFHVQNGDDAGRFSTQLFCVPVAPHQSRALHVGVARMPKVDGDGLGAKIQNSLFSLLYPVVMAMISSHKIRMKLFDGDNVFLNVQETNLQQHHQGDWRKGYYMPAPCDRGVIGARQWMDKAGHPFPINPQITRGPIDRRRLLDRYSQHTTHCKQCQADVKKLEGLMLWAKALSAALVLAACAMVGTVGWQGLLQSTAPYVTQAGAAVGMLVVAAAWAAVGLVAKLEVARQEFFFTDYVHANVN